MLGRLVSYVVARASRVLFATVLVVLTAGVFGSSAVAHLSSGGFTDSSSPSTRADAILAQHFHQGDPNLVFLVQCAGSVNTPQARLAGTTLATELASQPYVSNVASYWTAPAAGRAGLESRDGRSALITVSVAGSDNVAPKRGEALALRYDGPHDGVTVQAGGPTIIDYQANQQISHDLAVAEAVALPLTLIALVLVFGSVVAALLPLAVGGLAIVGTLAVLRLLTLFVPVSIYALNLTTAMGLGLAIDYSLFILSRYREELGAGNEVQAAIHAAVRTAGRTVLFSALAVGLSMIAMFVFPFYFLRSFAYAGLAVIAVAGLGAIVVLPALLAVLGKRVNAWDARPALRRLFGSRVHSPREPAVHDGRSNRDGDGGFWRVLALAVMRRPVLFGGAVVTVLVVLGAPFLSVRFGLPDDRVLPASATSHQVGDVMRADFNQDDFNALTVVLPDVANVAPAELSSYARRLSVVNGVNAVISPEGTYVSGDRAADLVTPLRDRGTYLTVQDNVVPYSPAGEALVSAVRKVPAPAEALVTGTAARSVDSLDALGAALPLAIGIVAVSAFAVLFFFTRSLVVPLKALVLNTLSLSATFGAMVWVFQDGHLSSLLGGVDATGYLAASMPVLMFCIAFGLSMDYEVFLVSRIREEWLRSDRSAAANTAAVAKGLERTGRIVTAAAALISIVFIAVATSQVSFIKMFGTGMALAVLVDASLVRGVLVPAFMRLAGRANWWAPRWLSTRVGSGAHLHVLEPEYELPPA